MTTGMIAPPPPHLQRHFLSRAKRKGKEARYLFQKGPHWGPHSSHGFGLTMRRSLFFMTAHILNPLSAPHLRTAPPHCWRSAHTCSESESNNSDSVSYLVLRLSWDLSASCLGVLNTKAVGSEMLRSVLSYLSKQK